MQANDSAYGLPTKMLALTAKSLYTPLEQIERPLVLVEDGRVTELASQAAREIPRGAEILDFGDGILAPGFVDIHIHGGAGYDVMQPEPDGFFRLGQFLSRHGVTSYLPTTVTAPLDQTLTALQRMADAIESAQNRDEEMGAVPVGIHLEGPFLSRVRCGVHPVQHLLFPTIEVFERLWSAARGFIRVMTIAPELPGAEEVIISASRKGVCVSIGHSDATLPEARKAAAAGARHSTHIFNAMRPLQQREPGILGELLTNPAISADVIADGIHVDPTILRLVLQMKGWEGAVLITDATAATGMPDGPYQLGSIEVEVKDGKCVAGGKLAGSVLTMDRAICNIREFAGCSLRQAVSLATANPSRITGFLDRGVLRTGARADLVVLEPSGEVKGTIIGGRLCANQ